MKITTWLFDLQKNLRSSRVCRALGAKFLSFDKINIKKWMKVNMRIDRLPDVHIVERMFAGIPGLYDDGLGLDYFIPQDTAVILRQSDWGEQYVSLRSEGFVCFAIGAAHATKRLPVDLIIKICLGIKSKVILLGGPGDQRVGEQIRKEVGADVLNACGKVSLHASALMVKESCGLVTHDTGMMHIAAALKRPIVSIWGNTIPSFGMWPFYGENMKVSFSIHEVEGLKCRPCSKIGFSRCPKKHFRCMRDQKLDGILSAINTEVIFKHE